MPRETIYFWAAYFDDPKRQGQFFKEKYPRSDDTSISEFAESQGENWLDHDFLEIGFEDKGNLREKFAKYSFSNYWMEEFVKRVAAKNLSDFNTLVLYIKDKNYARIQQAQSFEGSGYWGEYLGEFEFEYKHPPGLQAILDGMGKD